MPNPRARTTNAESIPLLDTNPARPGEQATGMGEFVRMKVQTTDPGGNHNICLARFWNGQALGSSDIAVEISRKMEVGDIFFGFRPVGGTFELYNALPVIWRAVYSESRGQYMGEVRSMQTNLVAGWNLPLAIPDRNEVET